MYTTAILTAIELHDPARPVVRLVYIGDAGEKTAQVYEPTGGVTEDWLKQAARNDLAALNRVQTLEKLPLGALDLTLPAAPADPDPARTQFLADHHQFQAMTRAIALGYTVADKTYTDLQAKLQAAWIPAYLGIV